MDNIVLIGMPGAGKSTVGVLVAKGLGYSFVDTDLVIQQREGALLQDLVNNLGTPDFLAVEAEAVASLDCHRTVIATGGSVVCHPRGIGHLKTLGTLVYLDIPYEILAHRIDNIESRGIAMAPHETLRQVFDQRKKLYQRYADIVVRSGDQTLEETVSAVIQTLTAT